MLYLNKQQRHELVGHADNALPEEACGIIAGKGERVDRIYPMTNTDKSARTFFMNSEEQLKVMKDIRNSGIVMIGIYHSHPQTEAYPSAHDVELAYYPEASYVIISLRDRNNPDVRSFKIIEGKITEEKVVVQ